MSLAEDDKKWIEARLAGLYERIEERIERGETRLDQRIERVEARLDQRIERVEARLDQRIERVETSLLTEFHKWASPLEMRVRSHSATMRALDLEVETLSERVTKLEPPQ